MAKYGDRWSRDEDVLALYLYCQIPFAKTKANNPEVVRLAGLIGRTPASVARKLGNFGAFDPLLARQGITGLIHASTGTRRVWEEFDNRWEALVEESTRLLAALSAPVPGTGGAGNSDDSEDELIIARPPGPSERTATVSIRLFQAFFRRTVLASYNASCCVCGLNIRPLLSASHIVPWSVDETNRSEPENGLCLCAIHDRAFDRGLVGISDEFRLIVNPKILPSTQRFVRTSLVEFHNEPIRRPTRFAPRLEFLAWHRLNIFGRDRCAALDSRKAIDR